MLRSIFYRFLKKPVLTWHLWLVNGVFLICEQGCRDLGVSPKKMSSVYDLKIDFSSGRQKKKKNLSLSVQKVCELQ